MSAECLQQQDDLQQQHDDRLRIEYRAQEFFRWALEHIDCPLDDCHAATYLAGIRWADVATRRAA